MDTKFDIKIKSFYLWFKFGWVVSILNLSLERFSSRLHSDSGVKETTPTRPSVWFVTEPSSSVTSFGSTSEKTTRVRRGTPESLSESCLIRHVREVRDPQSHVPRRTWHARQDVSGLRLELKLQLYLCEQNGFRPPCLRVSTLEFHMTFRHRNSLTTRRWRMRL